MPLTSRGIRRYVPTGEVYELRNIVLVYKCKWESFIYVQREIKVHKNKP